MKLSWKVDREWGQCREAGFVDFGPIGCASFGYALGSVLTTLRRLWERLGKRYPPGKRGVQRRRQRPLVESRMPCTRRSQP